MQKRVKFQVSNTQSNWWDSTRCGLPLDAWQLVRGTAPGRAQPRYSPPGKIYRYEQKLNQYGRTLNYIILPPFMQYISNKILIYYLLSYRYSLRDAIFSVHQVIIRRLEKTYIKDTLRRESTIFRTLEEANKTRLGRRSKQVY